MVHRDISLFNGSRAPKNCVKNDNVVVLCKVSEHGVDFYFIFFYLLGLTAATRSGPENMENRLSPLAEEVSSLELAESPWLADQVLFTASLLTDTTTSVNCISHSTTHPKKLAPYSTIHSQVLGPSWCFFMNLVMTVCLFVVPVVAVCTVHHHITTMLLKHLNVRYTGLRVYSLPVNSVLCYFRKPSVHPNQHVIT